MSEEKTNGVDKVSKYGWTVADKPGRLEMIRKGDLKIDHDYQRDVLSTDLKVKRIAAEWSWVACGAIIVANRDGQHFVIDGQHRVMAALKRSDIHSIPCIVFDSSDQRAEADGFLRANRNRKPMTAIAAFKAMVMSGHEVAVKSKAMIDESGLKIGKATGKGNFVAVSALMNAIETDEAALRRIWPLMVSLFEDGSIHGHTLRGMHYLERRLSGESLSDPFWVSRALRIGANDILKSMQSAVAYHGASGEAVWSKGIMNALNKGQKVRILSIGGNNA